MLALQKLQQQPVLRGKEQILQRFEEQHGPEGRRLFEGFLAQLKGLEQQNGLRDSPPLLKMVPQQGIVSASAR